MKTAERKDLQTNTLKQYGTDLLHGGKRVPYLIWVLPLMVLVVWVVYMFWTNIAASRISNVWAAFWAVRDGRNDEFAQERLRGTVAFRAWQFDRADRLYQRGYDDLFLRPTEGVKTLKEASGLYEELSQASDVAPLMALQALSGAGRCEECLGEIDRARFFYQAMIDRFGKGGNWTTHPLIEDAKERLIQLGQNDSRRAFAEKWLREQLQMLGDRPPARPFEPDPILPPLMGDRP